VRGIGTKTAAALVNKYHSLENIFERLHEIPPRPAAALTSQREDAFLYRRIVTVVTDLSLNTAAEDLPELHFDRQARARGLLDSLGY